MNRTRSYRREVRNKHIARKKRICRAIYGASIGGAETPGAWYKHDGQYSKGKIHCSCKICKYSRHFGLPTILDERELEKFNNEVADYYKEKYNNEKLN